MKFILENNNMNKNNKKYPWETHSHIWKTKAAFFSYLRGNLRKAIWDTYPVKLDFKNNNVSAPPPDYKGRAKSGAYCSLSGEWVPKSYLEVDHKILRLYQIFIDNTVLM